LLLSRLRDGWRKNAPELIGLFSGALPAFVAASRPADVLEGIPVFCYHLVEAAALRRDLEFLRRNGYRTLGAPAFLDHLEGGTSVSPRSVLLTFDDGPRNFFDVALPLLREFQAQALVFAAPGLHADDDPAEEQRDRPMTWRELGVAHRSGLVDVQSHTLESRYVPQWPAPAALAGCAPALEAQRRRATALPLAMDLARSQWLLEERLPGAVVRHLSFPMYHGTEEAVALARSLGFRACYWGYREGRPLNTAGQSPFYVSRLSDEFVRRLPGDGRASLLDLARERARRIRAARHWARRYDAGPSALHEGAAS